jgi:hypothetical protein
MIEIVRLSSNEDKLLINGAPEKVWGAHTWSPHDSDRELAEWEDQLVAWFATADRGWVGFLEDREGDLETTQGDIERAGRHARWCVRNGIVYQCSLIHASGIKRPDLPSAHKRHIDRVLMEVGDLDERIILEAANEAPRWEYSREVVRYLRAQGWKGLIAVNTSKNGPVQQLEDVGADIIAVTPSYRPTKKLVYQIDDDHISPGQPVDWKHWLDFGGSMFLIMMAWDDPDLPGIESHIPGWDKPWNDPNNPRIPKKIKWMQNKIGDYRGPGDLPPPPPPPGPGEEVIDVAEWYAPTSMENKHLERADQQPGRGAYMGNRRRGGLMTTAKTESGWPIDALVVGDREIYPLLTENQEASGGWGDSTSYKLSQPSGRRFPRIITVPQSGRFSIRTEVRDSRYEIVDSCVSQGFADLGPCAYTLHGIYRVDKFIEAEWLGDLRPDSRCIVLDWEWSGPNKERVIESYILAEKMGRFYWIETRNGVVVNKSIPRTKIVDGPPAAPILDCGLEERIAEIRASGKMGVDSGGSGGGGGGGKKKGCSLFVVIVAVVVAMLMSCL